MIDLILIRHGATAGNLEKRYIGRTDEPLCELGIAQGKQLSLMAFQAEHLFVSPMLRTRQTAELVFPNRPYTVVCDLTETDFGNFEGKTADELANDAAYLAWVSSGCLAPIPGGESVAAFKKRCSDAFLNTLSTLSDGASAAFVLHGGVIMAILEALGPKDGSFYDYHIPNGGYLRCRYRGGRMELL